MAVTRAGTTIRVAADNDTVSGIVVCKSITYTGGSSASATIRAGDASGNILWTITSDTPDTFPVKFRETQGLHVDLAGGAVIYIHTC